MERKGGVTIPLFECIFDPTGEKMESWNREFDEGLYQVLPNLYAVCVAKKKGGNRRVVAGVVLKTSYTHDDDEFLAELLNIVNKSEKLRRFAGQGVSFLPARLGLPDPAPPTEDEMIRVMMTQYVKHSTGGRA